MLLYIGFTIACCVACLLMGAFLQHMRHGRGVEDRISNLEELYGEVYVLTKGHEIPKDKESLND